MKTKLFVGLTLAFVGTFTWAGSGFELYSYSWGKRWALTVSEQQLIDSPAWSSSKGEPPIGPGEAIRLAQPVFQRLKREHKNYTWMLESLTLVPADAGNPDEEFSNDRWYWVAKYLHYPDNGGGVLPEMQILVLMDGTVVEPVLKPVDDDEPTIPK